MSLRIFSLILISEILQTNLFADDRLAVPCEQAIGGIPDLQNEWLSQLQALQTRAALEENLVGMPLEVGLFYRAANFEDPSGDFIRTIRLEDGSLSLFVGDIEDHGQRSARDAFRFLKAINLSDINFRQSYFSFSAAGPIAFLAEHVRMEERTTAVLGHVLFHPDTGMLEYARAGFEHLMIFRKSGQIEIVNPQDGMLIIKDVEENLRYRATSHSVSQVQLSEGDTFLLATDGLFDGRPIIAGESPTKIRNLLLKASKEPASLTAGEKIFFGNLNSAAQKSPQALADFLSEHIDRNISRHDGVKVEDDTSLIVLRWKHPKS